MIRLKKKPAEEKKPEAVAVPAKACDGATEEMAASASPPAEAKGTAEGDSAGGFKLINGIGGKAVRKDGAKITGKKRTPGELRVQKDIADLDSGRIAKVNFPNPNDLTNFSVVVSPDSGLWQGATYHFTFEIPPNYPHEPPKVTCQTKIYHPNIDLMGKVCLNIIKEDWKPVLDVNAVIYGVIYLFYEPNPDDPLNPEAAELYRSDIQQ
ncbi:UbcE2M, partial [Symbiodinium microadriaticum]